MNYISTRGGMPPRRFCEILLMGLAPDGGLVMPASYPAIDRQTLDGRLLRKRTMAKYLAARR